MVPPHPAFYFIGDSNEELSPMAAQEKRFHPSGACLTVFGTILYTPGAAITLACAHALSVFSFNLQRDLETVNHIQTGQDAD